MTHKLTMLFAATTIAGGLFAGTMVFAAENTPSSDSSTTQGTMGDHHGMMSMGQMGPDHMKQMAAMVDGCNRMMQSMGSTPAGHPKERAPDHNG